MNAKDGHVSTCTQYMVLIVQALCIRSMSFSSDAAVHKKRCRSRWQCGNNNPKGAKYTHVEYLWVLYWES